MNFCYHCDIMCSFICMATLTGPVIPAPHQCIHTTQMTCICIWNTNQHVQNGLVVKILQNDEKLYM